MLLDAKLLSVCPVVAGVTLVEMLVWCNVHIAAEVAVATGLVSICCVISGDGTSHHKCYTFHYS